MSNKYTQREKALQLHRLHQAGRPLILPNIWDVLGAKLLEDSGYPAVATASAAIAYSNGYLDGEQIPFGDLLSLLTRMANSVNVPVTADIESGFADDDAQLQKNIRLIIDTGIAGINIEDTNHQTKTLYPIGRQCDRIKLIKAVSEEFNIPLYINARADVMLCDMEYPTADLKYQELLKRGLAYKAAGADGFFPIALKQKEHIQDLVNQLNMPVNILILPGIPDLETLKNIGVARISLGPGFLKTAVKAMKSLAIELKDLGGLPSITGNEITSDYLKSLMKH